MGFGHLDSNTKPAAPSPRPNFLTAISLIGVLFTSLFLFSAIPTTLLALSGKIHWGETHTQAFRRLTGYNIPDSTRFTEASHHGGFWDGEGDINLTAELDTHTFSQLYMRAKMDPSFRPVFPDSKTIARRNNEADGVGFEITTFNPNSRQINITIFRNN
jgi:hypothetical protein